MLMILIRQNGKTSRKNISPKYLLNYYIIHEILYFLICDKLSKESTLHVYLWKLEFLFIFFKIVFKYNLILFN